MWSAVNSLSEVEGPYSRKVGLTLPLFEQLPAEVQFHNRWRIWVEHACPEDEKPPTDWRFLTPFQRLLLIRCLRPDRLVEAFRKFVSANLGPSFVADTAVPLKVSFADTTPTTPLFFILSPGVDPVCKVETLAAEFGFSYDAGNFFNVSLGKGQEGRATACLEECFREGGWVMLSNIHLAKTFLGELEKMLDTFGAKCQRAALVDLRKEERKLLLEEEQRQEAEQRKQSGVQTSHIQLLVDGVEVQEEELSGSSAADTTSLLDPDEEAILSERGHKDFRIFLSAEPLSTTETQVPIGILQACIKLTNEPPSGVKANMLRAMSEFSSEPWENSCKPSDFKAMLFSLCWFHAIVVERKKFGHLGWSKSYPFSTSDLTSCVDIFNNYMEERPMVPWEDLRYTFGEIIYGGHITDDWDRRLCNAYLHEFVRGDITEGYDLTPGYSIPNFSTHAEAMSAIESMPPEHPGFYGLHKHSELGHHLQSAEHLFKVVNDLQPSLLEVAERGPEEESEMMEMAEEILGVTLADEIHDLSDILDRLDEDKTPLQHVFYQECERMNILSGVMRSTLQELMLGLEGSLSMTERLLSLYDSVRSDSVPDAWAAVAFPSKRALGSWCSNLTQRNVQLLYWHHDFATPKVTRIDYFFSPLSFLTAVSQHSAMVNGYALDQVDIVCDVTKRTPDGIENHAREGSHIFGLKLEGARWDISLGVIEVASSKEVHFVMPVITVRALPRSKFERRDQYECPVFVTQARNRGFVSSLHFRTKHPVSKWVIAGVAGVLDVVDV